MLGYMGTEHACGYSSWIYSKFLAIRNFGTSESQITPSFPIHFNPLGVMPCSLVEDLSMFLHCEIFYDNILP